MHSQVFQVCEPDKPTKHLVLRKIKSQFISPQLKGFIEQQIDLLSRLSLHEVILPRVKSIGSNNYYLLQEYFPGTPLTNWLCHQQSLKDILTIFISIAHHLENSHKAGHIHKGLKPNNILLDPQTLEVQHIDDVRILDINQLSHFIYDDHFRVHTLPYLSPEQTGRIKYSINYSADLYSLGMILFESLTGQAAFLHDNPVEILHSHLAETPPRVETINTDIPEALGNIVELLLKKAPEKRYQTASGLKEDLKHCLFQLENDGAISTFTLATKDYSNHITIPSLMVGRETEKSLMLDEFEKCCSGVFRSALISGLSGIGKTRLIQELELPIVNHQAYFCSGKFDQFKKHIPYSTLTQAFTSLVKTILTEENTRLIYWKERITKRLGENSRLMIDLIPELELIIGEYEQVSDLPPVEARNRFNDTIGKFIACFASKEHPLTLFIDDLQWCDGASFDVLEQMFNNHHEYRYLFWIGAYRHNEVNESHRLTRLITQVKQAQRPLLEIRLEALEIDDVNRMTAYILNTYASRTNALSEVIFHTSVGNPLFVNESLRWLHTYKHLHLNEKGIWDWDDKQIRHAHMPESALDLFKDKISKLPSNTQQLLATSSALGARFNVEDLSIVSGKKSPQLYEELSEAFSQNILILEQEQLIFFHDQVQAAAESFMDNEEKLQVHHAIAKAFLNEIPDDANYGTLPNLFSIVEHLSKGRLKNTPDKDLYKEAELNFHAGISAMKSLAMDNANYFFKQAKTIYPYGKQGWDKNYDFLFLLYKYLARTEMALGNQNESSRILNVLIDHSESNLDRADCLYEQTTGLSSLGNFSKAIELGNRGLDFFDRRITGDDKECLAKADSLFDTMHKNNANVWQKILAIEPSNDRKINIETGIYSELIPDYYLSGMVPQLYLSAIQSTQNCLEGGVDESVIYGFSMMGLYLQRKDEYELSFRYEDLGLALAERYPDTFGATKGINGILWTNRHNRENSTTIIKQCQENIHRGKNCGDLYNAGLSYGPYIWHLICQGVNIQSISEVSEECISFSEKFNLSLSLGLAQSAIAGWSSFMQLDARQFSDEEISAYIDKWKKDKHVVSIGGYYTLKGMAHHYLGEYQIAAESLELAQPYLRGLSDNILNRLWYVFRYINGLHFDNRSDQESSFLEHCLQMVKTWAELGPILRPYLSLMLAERESQLSNFSEARRYYLDAIDASNKQQFTLLEAFLEQRYGELLIRYHHRHADQSFTQSAILFRQCGADVKSKQIVDKYSLSIPEPKSERDFDSELNQLLDVQYLQTVTAAITKELDFHPLITAIIKAIMERLGAKNAYLLLEENNELKIFAKGLKAHTVEVQLAMEESNDLDIENLSMAVANYVYATKKILVLENASRQGDFQVDKTVVSQQLKSIFCLPIIKQKKVMGVLYLENNLIPSVFTQRQIETARLLISQAAIALENAYLFEELKLKHDELTSSKDNLEITLNSIGDAVITTDAEGHVTRMNPVAEKLSGWSFKEAEGELLKIIFPIVDALSGKPIENPVEKVMLTGKTVHLNNHTTLIAKDGKRYQIADSAAPIRNGDNNILGVVLVFNDVTEAYHLREQSIIVHKQLQEQRDKLRQINQVVENSPVIVFRWKALDGWPVEIVSNNINQFGYTAKQLISGQVAYSSLIHPDDIDRIAHEVDVYSSSGVNEFQQEYRMVTSDGGVRWTDDRTTIERDEKGNVTHYQGTVIDITERKNMEDEIRSSEQHLKLYREQTPLAAIEWNLDFQVMDWNGAAENLFGYSLDEVKGWDFTDIMLPENSINNVKQVWDELIAQTGGTRSINENLTKDGRIILCEWHNTLLKDKKGSVIGAASLIIDITAEHKAKLALEQSEHELNETLNSLQEAVISINEKGVIFNFNSSAEILFGYSKAQILGENILLIIPGWNADSFVLPESNIKSSESHITYDNEFLEIQGQNKSSGGFPMSVALAELPERSKGSRQFIISCIDLTTQKLQQAQLQRSQKMDALGKLVGGIAHDYNNMLGVILGYSDLIMMKFSHVEGLNKFVEPITKAGERGRKLTSRMLAFSKHESTFPKAINLHSVIEEQCELWSKSLTASVTLSYQLCELCWLVWVDQSEFEDALLNLVINAKYAMPDGGELTLKTETLHLDKKQAGLLGLVRNDYMKLSITDTGCGIDSSTISNIFDPFFTTKGTAGTGLGLSQVYGFMERSGGTIKVSSQLNEGTEFSLYFPRYTGEDISGLESISETTDYQGDGQKILVVDDEPALRSLAKHILRLAGYRVLTASDGLEALDILSLNHVDLIVSDVIMPNMDGYQLSKHVSQLYPDIKIQLTSGFSDNRHHSISDEVLFKKQLHKPYTSSQLLESVYKLLNENHEHF